MPGNGAYLENEIIDANSEALVKTTFLELRTLEIDLIDAELTLEQEVNQLAAVYARKRSLVVYGDRKKRNLAERSFADPTFRIERVNRALEAEGRFQRAQMWVYLAAKSLEFKWSKNWDDTDDLSELPDGRNSIPRIIAARTAATLLDELQTMQNWDALRGPGWNLFYWNYSLRKDALGFTTDVDDIRDGVAVNLTPQLQFVQYLNELRSNPDYQYDLLPTNAPDGVIDHFAVPFSTVKFDIVDDDPSTAVIETRNDDNALETRVAVNAVPLFGNANWDHKMDQVRVNLVGNNIYPPNPQQMPVQLWYGGTGFLRYQFPVDGQLYRAFTMPNYEIFTLPRSFGWKANDFLRQSVTAKLVPNPRGIPEQVFQNINFREHPVAATDWRLMLPVSGVNVENIRDIEIVIIYRAR